MKIYLPILLLLSLFSCNSPKLKLNYSELFKVNDAHYQSSADTLKMFYNDESFIYSKDYNSLKAIVLIHKNLALAKKYKIVKTIGLQTERDFKILDSFSKNQIEYIESTYAKNTLFKKYAYYIVSKFDATEWWNINGALEALNERNQKKYESFIQVLLNYSNLKKDEIKNSPEKKFLDDLVLMFKEAGLVNLWTEKSESGNELAKKIEYLINEKTIHNNSYR